MKNFKLKFKRSPERNGLRGIHYAVDLAWMPDRKCYRVVRLQDVNPIPILDDMPSELREFLRIEIVDRMPLVVIDGCTSQAGYNAAISKTFPDSRQFLRRSGDILYLRFDQLMMGEAAYGFGFEDDHTVYLTQMAGEGGYNWALVAPKALIPCRTQLQAERLAQTLRLHDGNLWHQSLWDESDNLNPSTDPMDQMDYGVFVGHGEPTHSYAIDYSDIAEGFVALHAVEDHPNARELIEYMIVPWDMGMAAARDMIARIRDIAFGHDAEAEYVALIEAKAYHDGLDDILPLIETAISDRRDALGPNGEVEYK